MKTRSARHTEEQGESDQEVGPQIQIPNIDDDEETWGMQLAYYIETLEIPHLMLERIKRFQNWLSCLETGVGVACQDRVDQYSARTSTEPLAGECKVRSLNSPSRESEEDRHTPGAVEKRRALDKASRPNKRSRLVVLEEAVVNKPNKRFRPVVLEEAVVKAQNTQEGKAMTGSYLDWAAVRKLAAERIARGKAPEKEAGTTRTRKAKGSKEGMVMKVDFGRLDAYIAYFANVFGVAGFEHVKAFITECRKAGGPLRHKVISLAPSATGTLGRLRDACKQQGITLQEALNKSTTKMMYSAEFYRTYMKALTEVGDKSSETRREFENLGLMALLGVGRDFRTLVNIWLLYALWGLDINKAALKTSDKITEPAVRSARFQLMNRLQLGHDYYIVEEALGPGVFLLLGTTELGGLRFHKAGYLQTVIQSLVEVLPQSKGVCELIKDNIMNPLKDGEEPAAMWIETHQLTQETTPLIELMRCAEVDGIQLCRGVIEEVGEDRTPADGELDTSDIKGQDCPAGDERVAG